MSVNLYPVTRPEENNSGPQGTSVGGDKPLHRFLKGQPKTIGVAVIILGLSFFVTSVSVLGYRRYWHQWTLLLSSFTVGGLFVLCGILFIVTEHNPTKKTVTLSLALSVVTILTVTWSILMNVSDLGHTPWYFDHHESTNDYDELTTVEYHHLSFPSSSFSATSEAMLLRIYTIQKVCNFAGALIFIVMSILAGRALKSTKSKMVVVMTAAATETSAES